MADYDSDSSLSDASNDISTNVILGYASKDATDDTFSQLGGSPSFFDGTYPSPSLTRCKCCNTNMSLLLQLHGDMKSRFPDHERRLYLWACRQKQCRRKDGSVRGIRGVKSAKPQAKAGPQSATKAVSKEPEAKQENQQNIGSQLFGGNPFSPSSNGNPFTSSTPSNPFSTAPAPVSTLVAKVPQTPSAQETTSDLSATFAQKARIATPASDTTASVAPKEPWPEPDAFPQPYPSYFLDAETEYLSASSLPSEPPSASYAAFMDVDGESTQLSAQSSKDDAEAEMTIDKTFQHFADRVGQNDEQVLRYEFDGTPLLYSRTDAVAKLFTTTQPATNAKITTSGKGSRGVPRCQNCGTGRVFELQLMPRAIAELEIDENAATLLANGMEWGTIIMAVCEKDCSPPLDDDRVGYVEEWVGVQWEEQVKRK